MRIRFWGTRGSLPVSLTAADIKHKIVESLVAAAGRVRTRAEAQSFVEKELPFSVSHTYGGNSSCVELDVGSEDYILCDVGTGARPFGLHVMAQKKAKPSTFHVFLSHLHWDHIMGFPFLVPAYIPGNRVVIYGCHEAIEQAFRKQHATPCFPVDFSQLSAQVDFVRLEPGKRQRVAGLEVTPKLQMHGGDSYGYRFEHAGKVVVYSTDSEHKTDDKASTREFVDFFSQADLVIFDAMYSLADTVSVKEDWGHSSNIVGVELCQLAKARHLCLFHHEPVYSDAKIASVLEETLRLEQITREGHALKISSAYDGMEIVI
ncbi:MAG TPA: MBL fold metallo-hydrolase [Burkholderiales bacterium]|nr:MBL fold metallo-hydrolase [Burkholderiales bacterium]